MKYILFIYSFIFLLSCSDSKKSENKNDDSHLLVLDFDKYPVKDTLHASSFVASVTPIVLETTNDNLIGFLSAMQVTENCICILDGGPGGSGSLFVFDKSGKYERKIGKKGQGPGEYIGIHDFTIDEKKDEIFLVDNESEKIRVYQFSTGKFIRYMDFKDDKVEYQYIQYVNDKLFADFRYFTRTEKGPMLHVLDEATGNIESKCLDIDVHNHGWLKPFLKGESFFYCKNSEKPKYTHYFMDTIMTINNDRLEPYLVIKSEDWVTESDVKNNKNTTNNVDEDFYFKINELPIAFKVETYVESEDYIYFMYSKQRQFITVIYDKKNNTISRTKYLIDDIMFDKGNREIQLIGCGDENGMYGYINTGGVSSFYEYIVKDTLSTIKPEYRRFFENSITPDSNPIILYYEYKK